MAGAFNMMELMNNATHSEATKPRYEAATLPIESIISNPANLYSMTGIEELSDSLLLAGRVLQNIVVKAADENGKYMVISGHRRIAACRKLVEEGHTEFAEVPALVENEADENLRELMLIYTNSTSRVLTDAEKMHQARKATDILRSLKAEGRFEGRIREAVSRMLDTTSTQLARYAAIDSKLTNPELKEAFEDGRLKVSAAYEASGLSEEGQQQIADKLREEGGVSIQDVKDVKGQDREETWPTIKKPTEEPATEEPPAQSKVAATEAKLQSQGYDALTDCEKCKLATRCEDCCRVCPPEKHCNAMQCFIRDKEEKEQIAKEQAENNAAVLEHSKQEEQEEETPSNPLMYAAKTVLHELVLLREHYQGAAERQKAIATGKQGLDNLRATIDYLDKYVHKTERYIECLKEEDAIRNSIKGDADHEG